MTAKNVEFYKARDFGQTVSVTFEFLRLHLKTLGKPLLLFSGPFFVLSGFFIGISRQTMFSAGMTPFSLTQLSLSFLMSILFLLLGIIVLTAIVYSYIILYLNDENSISEIEKIWHTSKRSLIKVLGFSIGLFMIAFLLIIPFFITLASGNVFISFVVFLLIMIPIIYVSTSASLIFIVGISEQKGFIESLKRSFKLINKRWWVTFGLMIVFGMIQGFISFIFQLPETIMSVILLMSTSDGAESGFVSDSLNIIFSVISNLSYLLYAISITGLSFHYYSLIEQKEAKSLLQRIENL